MRYLYDVSRWIRFVHIRANLGMMLAGDYALCHKAKSTLVMLVTSITMQTGVEVYTTYVCSRQIKDDYLMTTACHKMARFV